MSHAANLRARQQAATLPQKRRKLSSEQSSPHLNGTTGLLNGDAAALKATPTAHPNSSKPALVQQSDVTYGHGQRETEAVEDDDESDAEEEEDSVSSEVEDSAGDEAAPNGPSKPDEEPSFADLLRERGEEPISVDVVHDSTLSKLPTNRTLSVPSANSLGTVLTQALRTNDVDLLESCLQVPNLESIRATIERLHSSLAASLLQKLAERMHKRPGRAGSLMVWIQWTIVAHGGYLASQPAAMKELHTLYTVVKQRASGLQPLLALKGKLDMLEAQMQLRRNMQKTSHRRGANDEDEDEAVIYIEGQENGDDQNTNLDVDESSSDEDDEELEILPNGLDDGEDDLEEEELDGEEDDEEDDESDDGDLIDDEADETDNDDDEDLSDEGIDYNDVDGRDNSDSEDEERRAPKKARAAR